MENTNVTLPFSKLRYETYLTLDVMMHVEYQEAYNFMFTVNKETRLFLLNNFITIRNGFINDGLIQFTVDSDFNGFYLLEKLYFSALNRNILNRILTISIYITDMFSFEYYK